MRAAKIGNLEVSAVGLGCNNFGRALDAGQSAAVVHAALDAGMTHFDTASNYGEGQSESFLGAALGKRRHEVVIASKVGVPIPGWEGSGGAQPKYVRQVLERSLSNLGTDYIDLYMIHFPDPETPETHVSRPTGKRAVTPARLCWRAPRTVILRIAMLPESGEMPAAEGW